MQYDHRTSRWIVACLICAGGLLLSTTAAAQNGPSLSPGDSRINVFGKAGFGGAADGEVREITESGSEVEEEFEDLEMEATHGVGAEYNFGVLENFLIGARTSLNWINTDAFDEENIDRSLLLNLDVVPRGRLPLNGAPIDFYFAAPMGVTFNFPNEDLDRELPFGGEQEFTTGTSWNVSGLVGVTYWFGSEVGVFLEEGVYHQKISFPNDTRVGGDTTRRVFNAGFTQFTVQAGLRIAL